VSDPEPVEIRLDRLLFPRPVPAGLDWAVLGLWVCRQRKTADPVDPPIVVRPEGDYFRIVDGRHRTAPDDRGNCQRPGRHRSPHRRAAVTQIPQQ
jgi:hypothetical protein